MSHNKKFKSNTVTENSKITESKYNDNNSGYNLKRKTVSFNKDVYEDYVKNFKKIKIEDDVFLEGVSNDEDDLVKKKLGNIEFAIMMKFKNVLNNISKLTKKIHSMANKMNKISDKLYVIEKKIDKNNKCKNNKDSEIKIKYNSDDYGMYA